jgi:DNA-binding transcriptional LysR family regulator
MRFRSYDGLRLFDVVARHLSFTAAAAELNLTKGAVSYQISRLETDLGFAVFDRGPRGVALTEKGERLRQASQAAFRDLDREIAELRDEGHGRITIAMATYFASRWLSPRLMTFISSHPQVALRVQPLINLIDLTAHDIDMAIRWGKGDWRDLEIEPLLPCPAFPTAGAAIAARVAEGGLEAVLPDGLVVPDPNVRVQAVIDGQGVALYDRLVADEVTAGRMFQISAVELSDYGYYLAYPKGALSNPSLKAFRDWIVAEALG